MYGASAFVFLSLYVPQAAAPELAYSMIHMMISQPQQAPATAVASGFAWARDE